MRESYRLASGESNAPEIPKEGIDMAGRKPRDTQRYHITGRYGKILHTGITNNADRRLQEHQRDLGQNVNMRKVGPKVTRASALKWEQEQREAGKPTGP